MTETPARVTVPLTAQAAWDLLQVLRLVAPDVADAYESTGGRVPDVAAWTAHVEVAWPERWKHLTPQERRDRLRAARRNLAAYAATEGATITRYDDEPTLHDPYDGREPESIFDAICNPSVLRLTAHGWRLT